MGRVVLAVPGFRAVEDEVGRRVDQPSIVLRGPIRQELGCPDVDRLLRCGSRRAASAELTAAAWITASGSASARARQDGVAIGQLDRPKPDSAASLVVPPLQASIS